jgi:hypothetical protein
MKKNLFRLVFTGLLIGITSSFALASHLSDISPNYWAYKEIMTLENDGVVVGYPDHTFLPDQSASRAEFATMTVKALRQENCNLDEYYYFKDVPKNHWAFDMIEKAHKFDLIKGYPTEYFSPAENISRLDAILMMVASVETSNISDKDAVDALKSFKDADSVPEKDRVNVGKAQILKIIANNPKFSDSVDPERKITRAEISYSLYNMRKQALQRPNPKLAEAMRPKFAEGIVIEPVYVNETIATIPAGTLIPVTLFSNVHSQKNKQGDVLIAKTPDNIVSKEKYLLIPKGSTLEGKVVSLKPARYFIRNAKATLDTENIAIYIKPKAPFGADVQLEKVHRNWFQKAVNFVIKGSKIKLNEGQEVYIKLTNPVKIDVTNQTILK